MLNSLTFKRNIVSNLSIIFFSLIYASFSYASSNMLYNTELDKLDLSKTVRVLSIDGGGIRGIIPATILADMEERLSVEFDRKIHICDCFDIIAGTSTGGIIALALNVRSEENPNRPEYEAEKLVKLYKEEKEKIFPKEWSFINALKDFKRPRYPAQGIEEVLQKYFKGHQLKDALTHTLVMTYNLHQSKHVLLDSKEANNDSKKNFYMKDAARATSAAPTYLCASTVNNVNGSNQYGFIDGGISANNPTWKAFEVALKERSDAAQYFVVSIGTGEAEASNPYPKLSQGGKLDWAPYVASIMMDSASHLVDEAMRGYACISPKKVFYSRLQTKLPFDAMEMDNTQAINIETLTGRALNTLSSDEYKNVKNFLSYYFEHALGYPRKVNNNNIIPRGLPLNQEVALSLNGINQYAEISEIYGTPFAVGKMPFTVEAWIKTTSLSDIKCIVRFGQASPHSDAVIAMQKGKILFGSYGIGWSGCSGNLLLSDDQWHHIAYTREGRNQTIYIDGVITEQDNKYDPNITSGYLRIGANTPGEQTSINFSGLIKNVKFWNIARSLPEIENDRASNNLTLSNNLIAYWTFNEEDMDKAHNLVTDKYHLDLINAPARVKL